MSSSARKLKYDQAKLIKLLRFLEDGRTSHSRQASLNDVAAAGTAKFPLPVAEREFYLDWARDEGLLDTDNGYFHSQDDQGTDEGFAIGYELTNEGHKFLYAHREAVFYKRWAKQVVDNVPTIVVAVCTALIISWATDWFGPTP